MSVDLSSAAAPPEPKRDRWGRYMVVGPKGGKANGYSRMTTIADTIDDRYNLELWKMRQVALGIGARPDLAALAASLQADEKKALNSLCKDATSAAQSGAKANLGTALHKMTERIDRGENFAPPEQWAPDIAAYRATLEAHSVRILPEWIETVVVLDDLKIAGTFDRIVEIDGRHYVADLKTGASVQYAWGSIAVQLAGYAHADAAYDYRDDSRRALPTVDQERALVIHLPPGEATCTLWWVDITAGWEALQTCMWVRGWRKRRDLANKIEASERARLPVPPTPPTEAAPSVQSVVSPVVTARAAIAARAAAVKTHPEALEALLVAWPAGVHGLGTEHEHTAAELNRIEAAISKVEARFELPFGAQASSDQNRRRHKPDEGDQITDWSELTSAVASAGDVRTAVYARWSEEATLSGRPYVMRKAPTQRRLAVGLAALALTALADDLEDELPRAVLGVAIGEDLQPAWSTGGVIGSMSIVEAAAARSIAEAVTADWSLISIADDGTARVAVDRIAS